MSESAIKAPQQVMFSRDEAAAMAIRVEDVRQIVESLLDGAEQSTHPSDARRMTLILIARERNQHLSYVASRLRGEMP